MKQRLKQAVAGPVNRVVDPRVANVIEHVNIRIDGVEHKLHDLDDLLRFIEKLIHQVEGNLVTDVQTAAEFAATFRRSTARIEERVRDIEAAVVQALGLLGHPEHPDHDLADLDFRTARFLNWASGHEGFAAQAGLWFNPPVTVEHGVGQVTPGDVTERIVEAPYAFASVAGLPPGSRILDFGAVESTTALSLASLGHQVTAIDLRPYPLAHPNLTSVAEPIEDWEGPAEPFDAVLCISTLEHVGLGAYGEDAAGDGGENLDREILERIGGWLAPEGFLVFTAPYGTWEVTEGQRVYDDEHLDALFDGWQVSDRRVCVQTARDRWEPRGAGAAVEAGARAVVLLRASRP